MNESSTYSSSTSASSHHSREKLAENVENLMDHADALLKATTAVSSEGVALARTNLMQSLQSVRSQLDRFQALAIQNARQAVQVTDSYVRRHPWQAVSIAAAAGFFVSILGVLSRRGTSR